MKNDEDTKKDAAQIIGEKLTGGLSEMAYHQINDNVSNPWLLSGP